MSWNGVRKGCSALACLTGRYDVRRSQILDHDFEVSYLARCSANTRSARIWRSLSIDEVGLRSCSTRIRLPYSIRRPTAMNEVIQHRLDANAMPSDANIVRSEKVKVIFELHINHLLMQIIAQKTERRQTHALRPHCAIG